MLSRQRAASNDIGLLLLTASLAITGCERPAAPSSSSSTSAVATDFDPRVSEVSSLPKAKFPQMKVCQNLEDAQNFARSLQSSFLCLKYFEQLIVVFDEVVRLDSTGGGFQQSGDRKHILIADFAKISAEIKTIETLEKSSSRGAYVGYTVGPLSEIVELLGAVLAGDSLPEYSDSSWERTSVLDG